VKRKIEGEKETSVDRNKCDGRLLSFYNIQIPAKQSKL